MKKKNKIKYFYFPSIYTIILVLFILLYLFVTGIVPLKEYKPSPENLEIHYLNVGEADCILIRNKEDNVLIDAGSNSDGKKIVKYLKNEGIKDFKYVFGTHAHEDHIGGMDDIINNFDVKNYYMPNIILDTPTYNGVIKSLYKKNMNVSIPKIGDKLYFGESILEVLYVGDNKDDINGSSIVIRLDYKNTSFLFMSDAPVDVESKIINKNIKADVTKIGHHGSSDSSSKTFIEKVNPTYAIISVGVNNDYYHPHDIVLKRLDNLDIKVYRTDIDGTIIAKSDGNTIIFITKETDTDGK